jgi:pimeloyl-ACP methyl ester carboxylesterase
VRSHPGQILKSYYIFLFQLPGIPEAMLRRQNWKRMVNAIQKTCPLNTFSRNDFDDYREAWDQKDALTSMLNWYRALLRRPARLPARPRLSMPTLVLWGGQDFALGRELAEASVTLCENGELVVFDHANHWIQHEQAEEVNRRLLNFFRLV